MKRPTEYNKILRHLDSAMLVGQGKITSYAAGRAWGVAPTTARKWLLRWHGDKIVNYYKVMHRHDVEKRVFVPSARAFVDYHRMAGETMHFEVQLPEMPERELI